jgi:ribosome-binding protein aMBF1 (putative translation factor)
MLETQGRKMKSFAKRIITARQKAGLSQSEAARKWGFSYGLMSMWESGKRNPSGLYREKLERFLRRIEKQE